MIARRARLVLAVVLLAAAPAAGAGLSAQTLFRSAGIRDVTVSPSGRWALAHGVKGDAHGLLAQKLGSGRVTPVLAAPQAIHGVHWIGPDTFLVLFADGWRSALIGRLHERDGEVRLAQRTLQAPGGLVDPLPLVDDTLVWEFEYEGRNSVHRVRIADLADFRDADRTAWGRVHLGETLATIRGSARHWIVDRHGAPRAALREEDGTSEILVREADADDFHTAYRFEATGDAIVPISTTPDGRRLWVLAYGGHDTLGIHTFDAASAELGPRVFGREDVDVDDAVVDPIHGELVAAVYEDAGERRYHYLDGPTNADLHALRETFPTESLAIVSRSADRQVYVLFVSGPTNPGAYYLRNAATGETTLVARMAETVDTEALADAETLVVEREDGARIEAFLTLPRTAGEAPAPLVVYPHGGPIRVRDRRDYDEFIQYLASWGFAVLQVNYRGSSGYGRRFEEAGHRQWGRGIEDDIDAAVARAVARPDVDEERLCVVGGSYGGFSALTGILRHPARYRCAVTINGVTDVPLMFETSDFAEHEHARARFAEVVGDPETEREHLLEISPAYHVDRMQTPVFVVWGTEDRRVDPEHAHRLLLMLETLGKPHRALEVRGAAHGFTPRQWIPVARALRHFLTEHLLPGQPFVPDPDTPPETGFVALPPVEW